MKIAIAGYGVEGEASYRYFAADHEVTIVDENLKSVDELPAGVDTLFGPGAFGKLDEFDMVIRTPGLAPDQIKTKGTIWSATNEFFEKCPAPIVGVTGTKGKGTTCSLIASILSQTGRRVHLVGNIGTPALDVLPTILADDVVVYELSSFQLWDIQKSPHIAVVLMIEPDHLNVHSDMQEYIQSKANIRRFQQGQDICFYHPTNSYAYEIATATDVGRKLRYASTESVSIENGWFVAANKRICQTSEVKLPGEFNLENACAAIAAARVFTEDNQAIATGLAQFEGLPHRLKYVATIDEVDYYDDSIATTPGSAIAALQVFEQPKTIILGGVDKGAGYTAVIEVCKKVQANVVAIGSTGPKIHQICQQQGVNSELVTGGMTEMVAAARRLTPRGGVILLSPASASQDQYPTYVMRSEAFIAAVKGE